MRKVLYIMGLLNDGDIEWMSQSGRRLALQNGDVIIREGVEVPDLFIVLDQLSMAGTRFQHMLKKLMGARAG
ncbi:MAG: hypothetical protein FJX62_04995 [Alphaproteobacteria bacterium]|nr:hypothetical protein [Alphaproteobacteria bacterium]